MAASLAPVSELASTPTTGHEPGNTPCAQYCCGPHAVGHCASELGAVLVHAVGWAVTMIASVNDVDVSHFQEDRTITAP
jgi:hypothetical protein